MVVPTLSVNKGRFRDGNVELEKHVNIYDRK